MRTYPEAIEYLNRFINYERSHPAQYSPETLSLARVERLLDRLGQPQRSLPAAIHIAAAKGKGPTAAMIDSALRAAGYRSGLYTSPHLHPFRERIQVNRQLITRDEFTVLINDIEPHVDAIAGLTWFEIITTLAFLHFAQAKIDVAVLEVGLGGRFDATNVVTPTVSAITSLSLDHTKLLGDTLAQIAFEKAGIIKPGVPVVSAPQVPAALEVVERVAHGREAPLILVGRDVTYEPVASSPTGQDFRIRLRSPLLMTAASSSREEVGTRPFCIPLLGAHQIVNATVAVAALEVANGRGLHVSVGAIRAGLAQVQWPGRLEMLSREPLVVIDGAHNGDSARKLAQALTDVFGERRWSLILGISADKDIPAIVDALAPLAEQVIVTRAHNTRAADVEVLAQAVAAQGAEPIVAASVEEAVEIGLAYHCPIIATGSLFTAADARAAWAARSGTPLTERDE